MKDVHELGLAHKDVKAANMVFRTASTDASQLVLIDFGFAMPLQGKALDLARMRISTMTMMPYSGISAWCVARQRFF